MKKIIKISLSSLALLTIISCGGYYYYSQIYLPDITEKTIQILEGETLVDEIIVRGKESIIVLDDNNNEVDNFTAKDIEKVEVSAPKKDGFIFHKWKVEQEESIKIKPLFLKEKDVIITYSIENKNHAHMTDNYNFTALTMPYKLKDDFYKELPKVELETNYKGNWYLKNDKETIPLPQKDDLENVKKFITKDSELVFITYQDKNNNNRDDFKETFTIKYVTNGAIVIEDKTVKWEETLTLPTLDEANKVFIDWYSDKDFKNKVTENTKVTSDMTVYAKLQSFNAFINSSVENPIYRKDLSLQIESLLNDRNNTIDSNYNDSVAEHQRIKEETKKYNRENNIVETPKTNTFEWKNTNHNKLFLITFLDSNGNYKFSVVAPYGQTIKIFDIHDNMIKEYSVRQQTTITLNDSNYSSEYYRINNAVYIKITENKV